MIILFMFFSHGKSINLMWHSSCVKSNKLWSNWLMHWEMYNLFLLNSIFFQNPTLISFNFMVIFKEKNSNNFLTSYYFETLSIASLEVIKVFITIDHGVCSWPQIYELRLIWLTSWSIWLFFSKSTLINFKFIVLLDDNS